MDRFFKYYLERRYTCCSTNVILYGTFLNGDNIYKSNLSNDGVIVMGNEGRGISKEVAKVITNRILIPNYPEGRKCADSLNVAISTAITCAEFRKRV